MTAPIAIIEAVAREIAHLRDHSDITSSRIATAVLAMISPKPLVWDYSKDFTFRVESKSNKYLCGYYRTHYRAYYENEQIGRAFETLEEAQAAAQAHADRPHWTNTKLGDLL